MNSSLNGINCLYLTSKVTKSLQQEMLNTVQKNEACGLLGGKVKDLRMAIATVIHPLPNLSLRNKSFAINPYDYYQKQNDIEISGLTVLAIYHSHLDGSTNPSFRDMALPRISGLPLLILVRNTNKMHVACYVEIDGSIVQIDVAEILKIEN